MSSGGARRARKERRGKPRATWAATLAGLPGVDERPLGAVGKHCSTDSLARSLISPWVGFHWLSSSATDLTNVGHFAGSSPKT